MGLILGQSALVSVAGIILGTLSATVFWQAPDRQYLAWAT
ncbi:hypothetical protein ACX80D_05795 [Arthrobacter sp. Sr24]